MRLLIAFAASFLAASTSVWAQKTFQVSVKPELVVQMGHTGWVFSAAISPNGKYLATGSLDNTVKLWNLSTGEIIRTLSGHVGFVSSVVFSPDGKYLATGSQDNSVKLWNLSTGEAIRSLPGQTSVAISSDGKYLATGSCDKTGKLWDFSTGGKVRDFKGHSGCVVAVAFSSDGKYVATASVDNSAKLWDLSTGENVATFSGHTASLTAVAVSPDGRYLATSSRDKTARLWELATGREIRSFKGHADAVSAVAFVPGGATLATGSYDGRAKLWDLATGQEIRTFKGHKGQVNSIAISADGKYLATGSFDKSAKLWELATGKEMRTFNGVTDWKGSVALSRDGKVLAAAGGGKTATAWDLATGNEIGTFKGHSQDVVSLGISPDGKLLAAGSIDATAKVWEVSTGAEVRTLKGHASAVESVVFTPDGKGLVTGDSSGLAKLWKLSTGEEVRTLKGHTQAIDSMAVTPDGKYLVTGSIDNTAKLWKLSSGTEVYTFQRPAFVNSVAISPDGKTFAVGYTGAASETALLEIPDGKVLKTFSMGGVIGISPDGKYLFTWNTLWNLATGEKLQTFKGHTKSVDAVAIAQDSRFIFTASADGTTRLWNLSSGAELCRLVSVEHGWVAVTPDGYFDGSPGGMQSIRWTVGVRSYPLEAFSEGYYVPGLLAKLLKGEPLSTAKLPNISEGFALPPLVKITKPRNGASLEAEEADVTVVATDQGGGIDEIRLFQNGKAVGTEARDIQVKGKGESRAQTFHVTLVDGQNDFKALALSKDRIEGNPDEITVNFKGPEKQASLHLLVVGVNQYKNSDLNLNYAQPDAKAIEGFFGSTPNKLFVATTKKELLDAQATKAGILAELDSLKSTPPQDVVVIYLAGHGESIENAWYFVPYDLVYPEQEEKVKTLGLSSEELKGAIREMGAQKVLLMMDACKSGGALLAFAGRGVEDRKALSMLARATGVHVVAASTKDQVASEVKDLGHGVFTYTLLEGLKGGAAKDGVVTVRGLLSYIEDQLPEVSRKYKTQAQYPVVNSNGMDFPLVSSGSR